MEFSQRRGMDNQEEFSTLSRADLIKLARESCTKNLSSRNFNSRNLASRNLSSSNLDSMYRNSKDKRLYGNTYTMTGKKFELPPFSIKFFVIRLLCALMIFLTVLMIDKMNINLKVVNSENIKNCVASNQEIENAEELVVSFFEDFVKAEE
jgi:hypothetical protein